MNSRNGVLHAADHLHQVSVSKQAETLFQVRHSCQTNTHAAHFQENYSCHEDKCETSIWFLYVASKKKTGEVSTLLNPAAGRAKLLWELTGLQESLSIVVLHLLGQSVPELLQVAPHSPHVSHVGFEETWLDASNLDSKGLHVQTASQEKKLRVRSPPAFREDSGRREDSDLTADCR